MHSPEPKRSSRDYQARLEGRQCICFQVGLRRVSEILIELDFSVADLFTCRLHGSGTPIGDALELEALSLARAEMGGDKKPCVIGSNKGNLGNTEVSSS